MVRSAPNCSVGGCGNTTWSESGLCYQHHSRPNNSEFASGLTLTDPIHRASGIGGSSSERTEIVSNVKKAFPDVDDIMSADSIREQSENTVRAAVSIEVYRRFKEADSPDPHAREANLKRIEDEIASEFAVRPVTFGAEDAHYLSYSSVDSYGRDLEDSSALCSYGVIQEWNMARIDATEYDRNGLQYGADPVAYCNKVSNLFQNIARSEFRNQTVRHYPRIVKETTGNPPLSMVPLVEGQDMNPILEADSAPTIVGQTDSDVRYTNIPEAASAPVSYQPPKQAPEPAPRREKRYGLFNPSPADRKRLEERREQERQEKDRQNQEQMHREGAKYYARQNRRGIFGR